MIAGLERLRMPWSQLRQLETEDWMERLGEERRGRAAYALVRHVPHFRLDAAVRPLSRQMLYVDVDVTPMFAFDPAGVHRDVHMVRELHLFMELPTGRLIHHECVHLPLSILHANSHLYGRDGAHHREEVEEESRYSCAPIVIPVTDPPPTHILVYAQSPYWLGVEAVAAVCLLNTQLPAPAPALRETTTATTMVTTRDAGTANEDDHEEHRKQQQQRSVQAEDVRSSLQGYGLAEASARVFPFETWNAMQRELVEPIMERVGENIFVGVPPAGVKRRWRSCLCCSLYSHRPLPRRRACLKSQRQPMLLLLLLLVVCSSM